VTIILHLALVWPGNLSIKQWKFVDYIWISLTAVGLVGTTRTVQKMISGNRLEDLSHQVAWSYDYFRRFISADNSSLPCILSYGKESSRKKFDGILNEYKGTCDWQKEIYRITTSDTSDFQEIDIEKFPKLSVSDSVMVKFKGFLLSKITDYNKSVMERKRNKELTQQSSAENITNYFAPIFLIIGLALRITKVTWEFRQL
jgi:hypothetical protein